jgi:hypothetical protein
MMGIGTAAFAIMRRVGRKPATVTATIAHWQPSSAMPGSLVKFRLAGKSIFGK